MNNQQTEVLENINTFKVNFGDDKYTIIKVTGEIIKSKEEGCANLFD